VKKSPNRHAFGTPAKDQDLLDMDIERKTKATIATTIYTAKKTKRTTSLYTYISNH
jgi:hypothetical protein